MKKATGTSVHDDFRLFLNDQFIKRCETNAHFSLRSFARYLGVDHSFLSKIFSGKRKLTETTLLKFGKRLGLNPGEISRFKTSVRVFKNTGRFEFQPLSMNDANLFAQWYFHALMELVTLENFIPSKEWIAGRLGVSPEVADKTVKSLIQTKYLKTETNGTWKISDPATTTVGAVPTSGELRGLQIQFLEKSIEAIRNVPVNLRDNTGLTIAIHQSQIKAAKKYISDFRKKFAAQMNKKKGADTVYQLSIAFFPLIKD